MKTPTIQPRCLLVSRSLVMSVSLCIYASLFGACGTNKNATKGSNTVAVRSVTYTGPIWVLSKKNQGQKFVQYKAPVWSSTGTPPEQSPAAESPPDAPPKK